MASGVQTEGNGEKQMKNLSIKEWMESNNISLLSDTYNKLTENGFNKMYVNCFAYFIFQIIWFWFCDSEDLQSFKSGEQIHSFAKDMEIKIVDIVKLKNAFDIFRIMPSNKKLYVDPEEINVIESMKLHIKKLENIIDNLNTKETNIKAQKIQIEQEINDTFDKLMNAVKQRKLVLLNRLNDIINDKNKLFKTEMVKYQNCLQNASKVKYETETMMETPISMEQIKDRKIKVMQNQTKLTQIVNNNERINISHKVSFVSDLNSAIQVKYRYLYVLL